MALTKVYTVTDVDGDPAEVEAFDGHVYVDVNEAGLKLTPEQVEELIQALYLAQDDALEQEPAQPEQEQPAYHWHTVPEVAGPPKFTFTIHNPTPRPSDEALRFAELLGEYYD